MKNILLILLSLVSVELVFYLMYITTKDKMFLTWFSKKFLVKDIEDREEED